MSQSPARKSQKDLHEAGLMRQLDKVIANANPFQLPDEFKGDQKPVQKRIGASASLYQSKSAAHHIKPDLKRQKFGADIDFDLFFAETGVENPPFSKTNVKDLERPCPVYDIMKRVQSAPSPQRTQTQQNIRDTTFMTAIQAQGREQFLNQMNEKNAQNFIQRVQIIQKNEESEFDQKQQIKRLGDKNMQLKNQKQTMITELAELQKQQTQLLTFTENQHKNLLQSGIQVQRYSALQGLFETLKASYPKLKPLDVLKKLESLKKLNQKVKDMQNSKINAFKQLEKEQLLAQIQAIKQQFVQQDQTQSKIKSLQEELEVLRQQNKDLIVEVSKAQDTQTRYLQVCQDITAFWIGIGKMYGTDLMETLKPSVNNPIEVLRAIDTVLTIVFPDTYRAQANQRMISAAAVTVWQKLLSKDKDAERLRNDSEAILQKAMDYYKLKTNDLKLLHNQAESIEIKYWKEREKVDLLLDECDKMVRFARSKGINVEKMDVIQGWERGRVKAKQLEEIRDKKVETRVLAMRPESVELM
ncbi:Conserved_hypothetical protein [Hexamita inflata]|uniref:Uncharacterized protein n=1 Tax=Hexamita inflata TaxID=28002 RepID=A0AA86Q873_9EUKA|nr:Conserved hypothetical protein [Hexamita inflata]